MGIKAVIFDLDGVIVSTDEYHYKAWKSISDKENINFDRTINNRLRGVSRAESLEIILEKANKEYTQEEKEVLLEEKNNVYKKLLTNLSSSEILEGVNEVIDYLKSNNIKVAIGSSSKNTSLILEKIGLSNTFDEIADGTMITKSKPDPQVFILAANKLGVSEKDCLVVEDAEAGVEAALNGNMKVAAVGDAIKCNKATFNLDKLIKLTDIVKKNN
ncbi:beta-phosphoglucomutase [Romboutsia weinsteinii]|uniref:Beta-phosphoglucomutase n=1 Tax=Romboutsia weinsteinii TaxID=2020949 RepID=A0A371J4N1_9FIRM|nr:beta-phosphoglucomutase [Romboutsia weinsteinii]RDY27695.1 beta-phosphoglucomutase [Romboutsia weinsteinii]